MAEGQENTSTTPQSMYDSEGKIQEPKKAEELAYLEKPARDREAELKRQEQTGLTKEQEGNVAILEGLQEKYPKAFNEAIDDKGRKVLTLNVWGDLANRLAGRKVVISREGVFSISGDVSYGDGDLDTTRLIDAYVEKRDEPGKSILQKTVLQADPSEVLSPEGKERFKGRPQKYIPMYTIDLSNENQREALKTALIQARDYSVKKEQERTEQEKKMDPQKILADL